MRLIVRFCTALTMGLLLALSPPASAQDFVEKKTFEMKEFKTHLGATVKGLKVGWEAYGKLNEAKDNVILITHFFSGTSNAAGKYSADQAVPGYWDAIIGPGKAIDTNKYYVISSDTLVNLNANMKGVITTGPASINPDTGKPYGRDFPIVTIRDFVNVQKALLESLGIKKLHAVMGASMGALQAYEWAATYPEMVGRVIPVIGSGFADANLIAWLDIWAAPIKVDPDWNNGAYYDKKPPLKGLAQSLKIVSLHAQSWKWANETFGRAWADPAKDPALSLDNRFKIEVALDAAGEARAKLSDANHFLYLVKANQLFLTGHGANPLEGLKKIKAPVLIIHSEDDLVFFPDEVRKTAADLQAAGTSVEVAKLVGKRGHLDGVLSISQAGDKIKAFLAK